MGDKRKKVVVTLEEKLQAIKRMDSGESVNKIALKLGVGKLLWVIGEEIAQRLKNGVLSK